MLAAIHPFDTELILIPILKDPDDWAVMVLDPVTGSGMKVIFFNKDGDASELAGVTSITAVNGDKTSIRPCDLAVAEVVRSQASNSALFRIFAVAVARGSDDKILSVTDMVKHGILTTLAEALVARLGLAMLDLGSTQK